MELSEHLNWLNSQNFKPGSSAEICQCGSEQAIQKSTAPERMRAELISYVFLDQFMCAHYPQFHVDFKIQFPGAMLRQHSFGGHASPSWFVYSRHGYDSNADWEMIQLTLREYMCGGLEWLKQQSNIEVEDFWRLVQHKIKNEFNSDHQAKLMLCGDLG